MIHLYESHLGGWYTLDQYEEPDYCGTCREFDEYVGAFQSMEGVALKLLKENASDEEIQLESVKNGHVTLDERLPVFSQTHTKAVAFF